MRKFCVILFLALGAAVTARAAVSFGSVVYAGGTSHQYEGTQTSETVTLSGSVTSGQRVVINIANEANSKIVSSITGPNGETATFRGKAQQSSVHNGEMWDYVATANSSAGATITVAWSSSENTTRNYVIYTVNGTSATQPDVAVVATVSSGFTTTINTTVTTTTDGDFVAGMVVYQGDNSMTLLNGTAVGAGVLALGGSVGIKVQPLYNIKTAHGSFGPGGTLNNNENVIVILTAFKPAGQDYWVDFGSGVDGNTGVTSAAPFKHCPGDTNATSVAASKTLAAGDTVHFPGGVVYTGDIPLKASGSSGLPITFDGNTAGTWGTGKAQMDLAATYYHAFNGNPARNYITINNFDIYGAKNMRNTIGAHVNRAGVEDTIVNYAGDGDTDSEGVIYNKGGSNWIISGCYLHDFENAYDRGILNAESFGQPNVYIYGCPVLKAAILFYGAAHGCVVTNTQFWAVGEACIKNFGATNFTYINNDFGGTTAAGATTNKGWFAVAMKLSDLSGTGAGQGVFRGNQVHEGWQYQGDEAQQRGHSGDWIHIFGSLSNGSGSPLSATTCVHDVVIDGNRFYNDHAFVAFNGTAYSLMESGWYNVTWQWNLFLNDFSGVVEFRDGDNIAFYNNTFLSTTNTTCLNPKAGSVPYNATNIIGTNNIFATLSPNSANTPCGTSSGYTNTVASIKFDYNLYYSPNNGNNVWAWNGVNYSFANWKTFSGSDAHSFYGNPNVTTWAAAASTSTGDYHPAVGSSLIGNGANLASLFTTDYDGTTITSWPIGALQSNGGGGGGGGGTTAASSMSGGVKLGGGVKLQ